MSIPAAELHLSSDAMSWILQVYPGDVLVFKQLTVDPSHLAFHRPLRPVSTIPIAGPLLQLSVGHADSTLLSACGERFALARRPTS